MNNSSITDRNRTIRFNDTIRNPLIRLIDEGITVSNYEAKRMAKDRGLDLVEVSFQRDRSGTPMSVCKICDHSKYIYEKKKSEKEAAKRARNNIIELKTIQFHITSDDNDVNRKIKNAIEFLNSKNKVQIEIFLRGREEHLTDMIKDKMDYILTNIPANIRIVEIPPKFNGRRYTTILRPINAK